MSDRKTAILTGASGGIGAAVAERLASDGFAVIVNYAGRAESADALVSRIEASGGTAIAVKADVSDPVAMTSLFDAAERAYGGVDVLVTVAGVMKLSPIADTDDASFDRHVAINLKGVFNGLREAARRLRDGGRIVNFSSSVVGLYQPTYGVYAATKAGVEAMTHVFSKELRGRRITVNAVAPGPIGTPLFTEGKTDEQIAAIAGMEPVRAPWRTGGRRERGLVPRRAGWRMGQRSGSACQRRHELTSGPHRRFIEKGDPCPRPCSSPARPAASAK